MPASEAADPPSWDALTAETLQASGGLKWTGCPGALGAWVAEMDFGTAPPVARVLHEAIDRPVIGYLTADAEAAMAQACAHWQARRYGWRVPPEWITPLPDVLVGLQAAIEHFSPPGSAVVLPTPAYMPFLVAPGLLGREVIQVPMVERDGRPTYDLEAIARAFAAGGGLLVHVNPHNPLGRVFTEKEQLALAEVVEAAGARVFADEIHAPLVHAGGRHRPYASLSPVTAGHTVTATSASKAWNLPGAKAAQLIVSSAADAAHWAEVGFLKRHATSTLGVLANTVAYTEGGPWLAGVLDYLDGNRLLLAELLAQRLPAVRYRPPEGTYLAWLDCRGLDLPAPAGAFFLERAGVALVDGAECGTAGEGHVRLNLATPRPVLRALVDRMATAVSGPA